MEGGPARRPVRRVPPEWPQGAGGDLPRRREGGRWTVWFEDGKPAEKAGFEKGLLQGDFATFFPGGARRVEGRYCHAIQCGRWTNWDEDGHELGHMQHEEIRNAP